MSCYPHVPRPGRGAAATAVAAGALLIPAMVGFGQARAAATTPHARTVRLTDLPAAGTAVQHVVPRRRLPERAGDRGTRPVGTPLVRGPGAPRVPAGAATQETLAGIPFVAATRVGQAADVSPPDTMMAAGPSSILEVVNSTISVWDKGGHRLGLPRVLDAMFPCAPSCLGGTTGGVASDPRVLYDAPSGRFFMSAVSYDPTGNNDDRSTVYVAVSHTIDPAGLWDVWPLVFDAGSLDDQPKIGVSDDKVVAGWTSFSNAACSPPLPRPAQCAAGEETWVVNKADLLGGGAAVRMTEPFSGAAVRTATSPATPYAVPAIDASRYVPLPIQSYDPAGTTAYVVFDESTYPVGRPATELVKVTGVPGVGPGVVAETSVHITVPSMSRPPEPSPQAGSAHLIDAGDNRPLSGVQRGRILWWAAGNSCDFSAYGDPAPRGCLHIEQLDVGAADLTPATQDINAGAPFQNYIFPAVALDGANDLYVSAGEVDASTHPSVVSTMQLATDPPGSLHAPIPVMHGSAPFYDGGDPSRFGDYSAAAADPSDPGKVWVAGEFVRDASPENAWMTVIGEVSATAPHTTVAVDGTDHALWVNHDGAGWDSLGGVLSAAPQAVAVPRGDSPLVYVVTGDDHRLWMRSGASGWSLFAGGGTYCLGSPGAAYDSAGNALAVVCRGGDNGLWLAESAIPAAGLPGQAGGFRPLGGASPFAPAVAEIGGDLRMFVTGNDGLLYQRGVLAGWSIVAGGRCTGRPAAAGGGYSIGWAGCRGGDDALWETETMGGGVWFPFISHGGRLTEAPGVAAHPDSAVFAVAGEGGVPYTLTVDDGGGGTRYVDVGGAALFGPAVGAA